MALRLLYAKNNNAASNQELVELCRTGSSLLCAASKFPGPHEKVSARLLFCLLGEK